jgi:predicted metalloprotease with PDZ domain
MNDQPYQTYVFIYHFPRATLYGGMEHGFSTAITLNAQVLSNNPDELADVTAHEFFHLWNVKRIRPQSLEPVDYTKENYCDALWFSEGVTSTVSSYILLRAGLLDEFRYIRRLADAIETLETRPAHLTQSARESSIDAWLEKYPYYNLPERSISYYNKGELLGVLLDLAMRDSSSNHASLRDLFHSMNSAARQGHFFADSQGVQRAAEAVSQSSFAGFFEKYVAGTTEVPWNDFFQTVGLQVVKYQIQVPDVGFSASRSFDALPSVQSVVPDGGAERAGLQVGDSIVEINGRAPAPHIEQQLGALRPGDKLRVHLRNAQGERELEWPVGSRQAVEFELKDVNNITPQQKARRAAWLKGESEGEQRP